MRKKTRSKHLKAPMAVLLACALICLDILPAAAKEASPAGEAAQVDFSSCIIEDVPYCEGEILITYSTDTAKESLEEAGIDSVEEIIFSDENGITAAAQLDDSVSVEEALEALSEDPDISWAQPNYYYELLDDAQEASVSSDASSDQYYLYSSSFTDAWEYVRTEGSVTVAVLDTGCNLSHEDLADNVLSDLAYDATTGKLLSESRIPNNGDAIGHGTNVCGIIAASAANGTGIAGASYNANILPVKIFNSREECTTSDLIEAYSYLSDLISSGTLTDLKVINLSAGYYSSGTDTADLLLEETITGMLEENGVLTVCAGGNNSDGENASAYCYPADFEECVSVTSVDADGSNSSFSDFNDAKDISAYGVDIYTTAANGGYTSTSGTSFSSPQVAAAAALLWAADSTLTPEQVVAILQATADEITGNIHEESGSAGILNAAAAVIYVLEGGPEVTELYGSTRYETSAAVALEAFSDTGSTYAVLAAGSSFPDALSAASLAGVLDAPVILVSDNTVSNTIDTLNELGVTDVYITGGSAAVSTYVEEIIEAAGIRAVRLWGETRQETALAVADEVLSLSGSSPSDTCIVASGAVFADALSASPYSWWSASPIYLTENDGTISGDVLEAIEDAGYSNAIILGGTSAVPEEVFAAVSAIDGVSAIRLGGETRYETSELIAEWSVSQGMSYNGLTAASGTSFPDALSGAALCGRNGSVLLLTNTTASGCGVISSVINENAGDISTMYILGGYAAVNTGIRRLLIFSLIG